MSKVFVMTNQASGNQVWVYDRSDTGKLTPPTEAFMFPTEGDGNGQPASTADPLFSQGSLAMTANHSAIFAANARTNDITSFEVAPDGRLRLADRASSGGVRPTSIAVRNDLVYVLNAGDPRLPGTGATITGLRLGAGSTLRTIPGSSRPIGGGASEIKLSPDGNHLVVINRTTSTIDVYPVNPDGSGTLLGVRSTLSAVGAPFGGSFLGRDNVGRDLLAVCSLGGTIALYGIGALGVAEPIGDPVRLRNAIASCWTAVNAPDLPEFLFVSSAGGGEPQPDGSTFVRPGTLTGFTVNRPAGAPPSLTEPADGPLNLSPVGADGQALPDFLGGTDMAVTSDSQFLYVIAATENNVPMDPRLPRERKWEIHGYRMNGTKLDPVDNEPVAAPVGSQGIVAS